MKTKDFLNTRNCNTKKIIKTIRSDPFYIKKDTAVEEKEYSIPKVLFEHNKKKKINIPVLCSFWKNRRRQIESIQRRMESVPIKKVEKNFIKILELKESLESVAIPKKSYIYTGEKSFKTEATHFKSTKKIHYESEEDEFEE